MSYHISEMTSYRWAETSYLRFDGKREFREKPQFGNTHVIFDINSEWGEEHLDDYNALDFPSGTVDHLAKFTEEKTSIPQNIAKIGIVGIALFGLFKIAKYLDE